MQKPSAYDAGFWKRSTGVCGDRNGQDDQKAGCGWVFCGLDGCESSNPLSLQTLNIDEQDRAQSHLAGRASSAFLFVSSVLVFLGSVLENSF